MPILLAELSDFWANVFVFLAAVVFMSGLISIPIWFFFHEKAQDRKRAAAQQEFARKLAAHAQNVFGRLCENTSNIDLRNEASRLVVTHPHLAGMAYRYLLDGMAKNKGDVHLRVMLLDFARIANMSEQAIRNDMAIRGIA